MSLAENDFGLNFANHEVLTYPTSSASSGSLFCKSGVGKLVGIMVTAVGNTPTLTVYDNSSGTVSGGTPIFASFTPVAGTMYQLGAPVLFKNGLYVVSTGSVGCTIVFY